MISRALRLAHRCPRLLHRGYALTAVFALAGTGLLLPSAASARVHTPASAAALPRSLMAVAKPKVAELRLMMQERIRIRHAHGKFARADQPFVKTIRDAKITKGNGKDGIYEGVVRVAAVWKSSPYCYGSKEEAYNEKMPQSKPALLSLFYLYQNGYWMFQDFSIDAVKTTD